MSSGNHAGPAGFNESGKPNDRSACTSMTSEPRGPGFRLAGLCATCGKTTTQRGTDGLARHDPG